MVVDGDAVGTEATPGTVVIPTTVAILTTGTDTVIPTTVVGVGGVRASGLGSDSAAGRSLLRS